MPFLQGSGAISINDILNMFGGPGSPSLANYYRGGAYIPATKPVTVFEPAGGGWTASPSPKTYWEDVYTGDQKTGYFYAYSRIFWGGVVIAEGFGGTSFTTGGFTYYRGPIWSGVEFYSYFIRRTSITNQNINTGIPSSGTISLSQFYGAEKP